MTPTRDGSSGLIPAHAGKTSQSHPRLCTHEAHPRSRGENRENDDVASLDIGSSPLTRGKPSNQAARGSRPGLIPAHAGKTRWCTPRRETGPAHPRSRGENQERDHDGHRPRWLIPAHAGKTTGRTYRSTCSTAHPRSRGENVVLASYLNATTGSSPLTRGKLADADRVRSLGRLIPAHAGKTGETRRPSPCSRAHPRSRGENICSPCMPKALSGSSPLTRGKPYRRTGSRLMPWLIPAHAGKTK